MRASLADWEHALPRTGSCTGALGSDLTHRVRSANIALSLIGGYAEVMRPGARAYLGAASSKQVHVVDIDADAGTASVCHLPLGLKEANPCEVGGLPSSLLATGVTTRCIHTAHAHCTVVQRIHTAFCTTRCIPHSLTSNGGINMLATSLETIYWEFKQVRPTLNMTER